MDRHIKQFDAMAKRTFGPDAIVRGTLGSERFAGQIRIDLDNRPLGSGATFGEAMQAAQRRAAELSRGKQM